MGQAPQNDLQQYLSLRNKIVEDIKARFEFLLIFQCKDLLLTDIFEGWIFNFINHFISVKRYFDAPWLQLDPH